MAKTIFTNQTANAVVDKYQDKDIYVDGKLQVDVSGVLDGADVITWLEGAANALTWVRTCSWISSKGDALDEGASAGTDFINNRKAVFEIRNAGASTDINLSFDVE